MSAVVPRIPVGNADGFGLALAEGLGLGDSANHRTWPPFAQPEQ